MEKKIMQVDFKGHSTEYFNVQSQNFQLANIYEIWKEAKQYIRLD